MPNATVFVDGHVIRGAAARFSGTADGVRLSRLAPRRTWWIQRPLAGLGVRGHDGANLAWQLSIVKVSRGSDDHSQAVGYDAGKSHQRTQTVCDSDVARLKVVFPHRCECRRTSRSAASANAADGNAVF